METENLNKRKKVKNVFEEFNLGLLIYIFNKSILWVFLFIFISYVFSRIYLRFADEIYESSAKVMLKKQKETQVLGVGEIIESHRNEIDLEIQLLKSRFLIEKAIKRLNLSVEYYSKGKFKNTENYINSPFSVDIEVYNPQIYQKEILVSFKENGNGTLFYNLFNNKVEQSFLLNEKITTKDFEINVKLKEGVSLDKVANEQYVIIPRSDESIVSEIHSQIEITPVNLSSKTIKILYRQQNAQKTKDIVKAISETFIDYDKEKKTESVNSVIEFLDEQIENFAVLYYDLQDTIKDFKQTTGFIDPEQKVEMLLSKLEKNEEEMMQLKIQIEALNWFSEQFKNDDNTSIISTYFLDQANINLLDEVLAIKELQSRRNQILLSVTPEHPKVQLINNEILIEKENILARIESYYDNINNKIEYLNNEKQKFLADLFEIPDQEAALNRILRDNNTKETFYLNLLDSKSMYEISKAGILSDYIFIEEPNLPKEPISPKRFFVQIIGIIIGLLLGILLIVLRYFLHNKVVSLAEINENTNANLLGMIPNHKQQMETSQVVVTENPKSSISEAFRSIRSNLEFINSEDRSKLIVTTSTIPGEGKTFIGINLAAILSLLDKKVIIIDYDLRKPRLNKVFDMNATKGISSILINKSTIEECIISTGIKNLDFIPSGPIPPNPAELINKKETRALIQELQKTYDYVLIDTPPIGLVTDALDLLKIADYPIYVVRADYSERMFLENINKLTYDNNINHLSVVLNDFGRGASSYTYSYGTYGYGYGYGYGQNYGHGYYSDDINSKRGFIKKFFKSIFN